MEFLENQFSDLERDKIFLMVLDPVTYSKTNLDLLKIFVSQKRFSGLYLSTNLPYETMIKMMMQNSIDATDIFFIDTTSNRCKSSKFYLCASPTSLTEISIAISEALKELPRNKKFVVIDSISSLLKHNSPDGVSKFIHFLAAKLKASNIVGIFFVVGQVLTDKPISKISHVADKIIVGGEK